MKKRKWIKWVILLLALVAAATAYAKLSGGAQSAAYREETVASGDLTTYYNFDGTVYAPRTQTIAAGAADKVERVYVRQNQQVEDGDRLYATQAGGIVRAEIDGELTGLFVTEGDMLAAGDMTAQIVDMSRLEARLNVDEYDVGAVTPGTQVEVTVLAPGAVIESAVSALDKNGTAAGDLSYYTATAPLEETQGVLPGMQVSARVLRGHAEDAAILHLDAIQFDEYNEPYVLVRGADGEETRVPVKVGISDGVYAEILDGVRAGDTVLVPTGMSMLELMQQMQRQSRN